MSHYTDESGEEKLLETLYGDENREWVDLTDIPKYMQDAAVAIEDERFWKHNGVDWKRTFAAVFNLMTGGSGAVLRLHHSAAGGQERHGGRRLQHDAQARGDFARAEPEQEIFQGGNPRVLSQHRLFRAEHQRGSGGRPRSILTRTSAS